MKRSMVTTPHQHDGRAGPGVVQPSAQVVSNQTLGGQGRRDRGSRRHDPREDSSIEGSDVEVSTDIKGSFPSKNIDKTKQHQHQHHNQHHNFRYKAPEVNQPNLDRHLQNYNLAQATLTTPIPSLKKSSLYVSPKVAPTKRARLSEPGIPQTLLLV
jgi:hypothetical protein